MKKAVFFLLTLAGITGLKAQISDMSFAAVRYNFSHITDTTLPNDPYIEGMVLLLGKNYSAYQSYDKIMRDSMFTRQAEEQLRSGSRSITIGSPGMKPVSRAVFFKEIATGKVKMLENLAGYYLVDIPAYDINWTILPETKNFKDLVCQKATATFKGRNYTAWFCPQLPYSNGPWKLGGLPGLILEAYDDKREVIFAFESFEDVTQRNMAIKTPVNNTPASLDQFRQLQEAYRKDPQAFMRARMSGGPSSDGISVVGVSNMPASISVQGATSGAKKREMNNPLEKSDR